MKLNVEIQKENTYGEQETIINIDVNCGNWKYWDDYMETDEKISLTMNNIYEAHYLALPVKDAYGHCDHELLKNEREFKIVNASVRTYDSLHEYLAHAINWAKEDFKSAVCDIMEYKEKGRTYNAVLFDEQFKKHCEDTVVEDIVYENECLITIKINWVE